MAGTAGTAAVAAAAAAAAAAGDGSGISSCLLRIHDLRNNSAKTIEQKRKTLKLNHCLSRIMRYSSCYLSGIATMLLLY